MARQISRDGEDKIVQWEGEILHAYDDFDPTHKAIKPGQPVRGTLTIGVGHTGPDVKAGMTITKEQSRALLRGDLKFAETAVEQAVKVQLNDNQFAALVSFAYNVGAGNFRSSTLLKKLNAGNYDAVPTELMKWSKSKGKVMQGLTNRRAQEAALWGKGAFVASAAVDVQKDAPKWVTPESIGAAGTAVAGAGAVASGSGPVQYALAAVLILAAIVAVGFFVWRRVAK